MSVGTPSSKSYVSGAPMPTLTSTRSTVGLKYWVRGQPFVFRTDASSSPSAGGSASTVSGLGLGLGMGRV